MSEHTDVCEIHRCTILKYKTGVLYQAVQGHAAAGGWDLNLVAPATEGLSKVITMDSTVYVC